MARTSGQSLAAVHARADAAVAEVSRDMEAVLPAEGNRWAHVANAYGRMVAQGGMELDGALSAMRGAAAQARPDMDASGRDMRMAHLLHDSVRRWDRARDRARFAIRRALGPLLAERAASARLMAVARAVNAEAAWPLCDVEVLGVVRNEAYWAARRARPVKVPA